MNQLEDEREENRCGQCKHWYANPADPMNLAAPRMGLCRAAPPQAIVVGAQQTVHGMGLTVDYRYPTLLANALGCGMYQERMQLTIKN